MIWRIDMFYGAVVWDPWLIVAQIVCLQCLYYLTLGIFMAGLVGTRVSRISLVYFFDYASVTVSTNTGWCVITSFILSSIAGAGYLVYVIERAKKCLDFASTLYVIHLFTSLVYGGWPSSLTWWVVNVTGFAVMALLGEYLCIKRELREIPISRYRSSKPFSPFSFSWALESLLAFKFSSFYFIFNISISHKQDNPKSCQPG
nr:protein SYS1 homolog [Ipomoea batatas]